MKPHETKTTKESKEIYDNISKNINYNMKYD